MTTHELLEMASLDAMGLLDADEREAFERAFRAASPALQAQVRREQLRLSRMDELLPNVEPPIGLRARVVAAVRDAIGQMTVRTLVPGSGGKAAPALRRSEGVHRFWRAAAIGSAAASLVLAYTAVQFRGEYLATTDVLSANAINDHLMRDFGARFKQLILDPASRKFAFHTQEGRQTTARATLLVDAASKRGHLLLSDLSSADGLLEVVTLDRDGRASAPLASFRASSTGIKHLPIDAIDLESVVQIVIRRVGETEPLLVARVV